MAGGVLAHKTVRNPVLRLGTAEQKAGAAQTRGRPPTPPGHNHIPGLNLEDSCGWRSQSLPSPDGATGPPVPPGRVAVQRPAGAKVHRQYSPSPAGLPLHCFQLPPRPNPGAPPQTPDGVFSSSSSTTALPIKLVAPGQTIRMSHTPSQSRTLFLDPGNHHIGVHLLIRKEGGQILRGRGHHSPVRQALGRGLGLEILVPADKHLADHRSVDGQCLLHRLRQLAVVVNGHIG